MAGMIVDGELGVRTGMGASVVFETTCSGWQPVLHCILEESEIRGSWAQLEQFRNTRRLFERIERRLFLDEKAT
jgi:hypothetical protein